MRPGGEPTYTFLTTGAPDEFETIGRRFLGPELVAASQFVGGLRMRLTVVGCSGSYPGPDSPASCYLSRPSRRRPHLAGAARPRQRRARRAAALRRPADASTPSSQPPARRPLPGPVRLLRAAQVPPRRRRSRGSRSGARPAPPTGWRAPTTCPTDPGMNAEFDFRAYDGTVESVRSGRAGARSRTRCRRTACGSTPTAGRSATPATPAPATGSTRSPPDADLLLAEASFRAGRRQPARPAPHRRRLRARPPPGRRPAAGADPRPAVARPARSALAEAHGGRTTARSSLAAAGAVCDAPERTG